MKRISIPIIFFLLFFTVSLSHAQTLTWTAGGVGGGWYTIAGGISNIINEKAAGITVKVIPGGGTVNPRLVDKGDCELGWGLPFLNVAAWNGEDPYDKKHTDLRAIAGGMSLNFFHFYVAADSPIKTMDEVSKQKKALRMAISPTGTSDEWVFRKVLASYKTDYKELEAAHPICWRSSPPGFSCDRFRIDWSRFGRWTIYLGLAKTSALNEYKKL
jgi:TRAP-type uncharacterized transport system substrate-binding protein